MGKKKIQLEGIENFSGLGVLKIKQAGQFEKLNEYLTESLAQAKVPTYNAEQFNPHITILKCFSEVIDTKLINNLDCYLKTQNCYKLPISLSLCNMNPYSVHKNWTLTPPPPTQGPPHPPPSVLHNVLLSNDYNRETRNSRNTENTKYYV